MSRSKPSQFVLAPEEAYRLFRITTDLADTLEDLLEAQGAYSKEFQKGLRVASQQAQKKQVRKIHSISELSQCDHGPPRRELLVTPQFEKDLKDVPTTV